MILNSTSDLKKEQKFYDVMINIHVKINISNTYKYNIIQHFCSQLSQTNKKKIQLEKSTARSWYASALSHTALLPFDIIICYAFL